MLENLITSNIKLWNSIKKVKYKIYYSGAYCISNLIMGAGVGLEPTI